MLWSYGSSSPVPLSAFLAWDLRSASLSSPPSPWHQVSDRADDALAEMGAAAVLALIEALKDSDALVSTRCRRRTMNLKS